MVDLKKGVVASVAPATPPQAKHAPAKVPKYTCPTGYSYISAGSFSMGSTMGLPCEKPVRQIYTDAYCLSKSEVSTAQFNNVRARAHLPPVGSGLSGANKPVHDVSWGDSDAYCKAIGGRLPTEAEWEKAARGPRGLDYGTKSGALSKAEAFYESSAADEPADVCSYPANGYGLCDMAGNVSEWTNDWYAADAYQQMKPRNPQGPNGGQKKVIRGGSFADYGGSLSAGTRFAAGPGCGHFYTGFRCVVPPKKSE